MQVVGEETGIVPGPPAGARSCCFPDLLHCRDGTLQASFRAGAHKDAADGRVYLTRSADGGRSWSPPAAPWESAWHGVPGEQRAAYLAEPEPGRLLVAVLWVDRSDPSLPFFNPDTEGLLPTAALLSESTDGGRTWSGLRVLDPAPFTTPLALTGPVLRLRDGVLAAQLELNKAYDDPGPWRHAAVLKLSADGGRTWPRHVIAARDPDRRRYYWDQRPALLPDGRLLTAFWTYDADAQRDLPVHLAWGSADAAEWTPPRDTGLEGQCPFPVAWGGDRVLLLWVDRYGGAALRAAASEDGGRTWGPSVAFFKRRSGPAGPASAETAAYLQEMELWDFGLPRGVLLPDGRVLAVYYAPDGAGGTRIGWARLALA